MADPGWYADPLGHADYRYFDGAHWTDQVSTGGSIETDPPVQATKLTPAEDHPPPPTEPNSPGPPAKGRSAGWLIAVGIIVVALAAGLFFLTGGDDGDSDGNSDGAAADEPVAPEDAILAEIDVGDEPQGVAVGDGAVWVVNTGDDTVSRIDPGSGEAETEIDVGDEPTDVAVGEDGVWVTNSGDDTVSRIDPADDEVVAEIDVAEYPIRVAVGEGAVWSMTGFGDDEGVTVTQIDPDDEEAVDEFDGSLLGDVAAGEGAVWVTQTEGSGVLRIDPETLEEEAEIEGDFYGADDLAAGEGSVWVTTYDDTLVEIDPEDDEVVEEVAVDSVDAVAVGEGAVWVTTFDGTLLRIDAENGEVLAEVELGDDLGAVAVGEGAVWVVDTGDETVVQVDPNVMGGVEEAAEDDDGDDGAAAPTTTEEEPATTTTESTGGGLSPEDEAACRYLIEQIDEPGGYDATVVLPTVVDMATDGGEVEAAAQRALASFQETGSVQPEAAADLVVACGSVL